MKNKKILFILIATFIFILLGTIKSRATLNLNELDFEAKINEDGSMQVTETWDIYISETNTLFKTFKKDSSKYSGITDVTVKEITGNKIAEFEEIYEEMYHVTKDCYYALTNSKGQFEIAWGVGLDDDSATKKYEISYTVLDAVAKYNDYAQLYWQFVGEDFEIDADKIKGTILIPQKATSKEDIRVWGHTKNLNGEIYATDLNKIEFTVNKYSGGTYVEVRTLFPKDMITSTARTYSSNILQKALEEETKWADEANARREAAERTKKIILIMGILLTIFFIIKIFKNIVKLKKLERKFKPEPKLEYFRELPYEDATPAEALFILTSGASRTFASSFSANILDLCLKKYLELEEVNKKTVKIKILEKEETDLKQDQKLALDFLKEVAGTSNELTTKEITKYLERHPSKVTSLDTKIAQIVEEYEIAQGKYSKEKQKEANKYVAFCVLYIVFAFFAIIFFPLAIVLGINAIITGIMANKVNVFTQEGVNEKEKWKAFKKYMTDFSLLKEKEVPSLIIWEKYLVFATAFGISEKVLKQLKVIYPEIMDMNSGMYAYSYIHIMNSVNIGDCINSSVYSAISSSGSGAGGGFSGGGGGGRWPEVAVADAKPFGDRF